MKASKAVELMKTGQFTILYHDNGYCTLHKGHGEYDQFNEEAMDGADIEYPMEIGYIPGIVSLLVKALGGKVDSI